MTGLEKFSHLEDKIYRAIEQFKALQQEKERLEKELMVHKRDLGASFAEKDRLQVQVERLLAEREEMKSRVEAMLDAISVIEQEVSQPVRR